MATWKKVVVSGSNAELNEVSSSALLANAVVFTSTGSKSANPLFTTSSFIWDAVTGTISGSNFSGSFFGDGTGLNVYLNVTASSHNSGSWQSGSNGYVNEAGAIEQFNLNPAVISQSINLGETHLQLSSSVNNLDISFPAAGYLQFDLAKRIETYAIEVQEGSGSFSGSFQGDGSKLTGIGGDLRVAGETIVEFPATNPKKDPVHTLYTGSILLQHERLIFTGSEQEVLVNYFTSSANGVPGITADTASHVFQIKLPQDVTIRRDLTVKGNLEVQGSVTATSRDVSNLAVQDQWILINSGSSDLGPAYNERDYDGGIVVETRKDGVGNRWEHFGWNSEQSMWSLGEYSDNVLAIDSTSKDFTSSIKLVSVDQQLTPPDLTNVVGPWHGGTQGTGQLWVDQTSGDIFIWS